MIDMHSHILFGVDDGPQSLEETLDMLARAVEEGITGIIATSHTVHPQYHVGFETVTQQIKQLTEILKEKNLPLELHTGHEVRLNEKIIEQFEQKKIQTLANSNYLLVEFPSSHIPHYSKKMFNELIVRGITPIIAHPERNKSIAEKPERLENLIREGAVAQITGGSLAGHFGKSIQKLSIDLVRNNLVHTFGSDVHNLTTRPFLFDAGLSYLEKNKLANQVDILLENNSRIIENKPFLLYEPEKIKKNWWGLFS